MRGTGEEQLTAADAAELLRAPDAVSSAVLRIVLERAREGSRPGERSDDALVCLAVEGGGMRGAVSAGMCVVLEAAGLVGAFDRIYGVSAGALNGCMTAAGQASLGATHYEDAATEGVVNHLRPLVGRPVIDFDLLFQRLIGARKPVSPAGLASGPEFRALATSLESFSLRVLADFADAGELMRAVRASCALPTLGGDPPLLRGERLADGALIEPMPFETALAEGATHVLVLRTRSAEFRKRALIGRVESLALRRDAGLLELYRTRDAVYNRQAAELERGVLGPRVDQVAVRARTRLPSRLDGNLERIAAALRLGARTMAAAVLNDQIDLCWQPLVYRATPAAAPAPERPRARTLLGEVAARPAETSA